MSENILECAICLQALELDGEHVAAALGCGHCFGFSCLAQYLRTGKKCPLCQQPARKAQVRKLFLAATGVVRTDEQTENLKRQLEEKDEELRQLKRRLPLAQLGQRLLEVRGKLSRNICYYSDHEVQFRLGADIYTVDLESKVYTVLASSIGENMGNYDQTIVGSRRLFDLETQKYSDLVFELKFFIEACECGAGTEKKAKVGISAQGHLYKQENGKFEQVTIPSKLPVACVVWVEKDVFLIFTYKECFVWESSQAEIEKLDYPDSCIAVSNVNEVKYLFVSTHRSNHALYLSRCEGRKISILATLAGHVLPFTTCRTGALCRADQLVLIAGADQQGKINLWKIDLLQPYRQPVQPELRCELEGIPGNTPTACDFFKASGQDVLVVLTPTLLTAHLVS